jgi:hypothetical protein
MTRAIAIPLAVVVTFAETGKTNSPRETIITSGSLVFPRSEKTRETEKKRAKGRRGKDRERRRIVRRNTDGLKFNRLP